MSTTLYRFRDGKIETETTRREEGDQFLFFDNTFTSKWSLWNAGWRWVGAWYHDKHGCGQIEEIWVNSDSTKATAENDWTAFHLHDPEDWKDVHYGQTARHKAEFPVVESQLDYLAVMRERLDRALAEHAQQILFGEPFLQVAWTDCQHDWVNTGTKLSFCRHCNADGEWSADYVGLKRSV